MTVQYEARGAELCVYLQGELGHPEALRLMSRLTALIDAHLPGRLILDLSGLEFMDSSGIAVVLHAQRRCSACGGKLSVRSTPAQAKKVLVTAGIHRLVDIQ